MQSATAMNLTPDMDNLLDTEDLVKMLTMLFAPPMDTKTMEELNVCTKLPDPDGKIFNWDEAARRIKQANAKQAFAGIFEDPDGTAGLILDGGIPVLRRGPDRSSITFLGSLWGTPVMMIDNEESKECWVLQSETEWTPQTKWPQSALDILNAE